MNKVSILGVNFDNVTQNQALDKIEQFITEKRFHYIVTPNPEFLLKARQDKEFKKILNEADLSIADGEGIIKAAYYLKTPLKERIPGTDLIINLMPYAEKKNYKIFLLGAKPEVNELTKQILCYRHPQLQIVGTDPSPKFSLEDLEKSPHLFDQLIGKINRSKADILLIAFGAPKQEKFIWKFKDELQVKIAIGIGGAFDYISGNTPRAPLIMRRLGLEWLFRLILRPSRIVRIFNAIIIFPLIVIFTKKQ
ncbi:MAG: WecB/TagA/CpsF family glycosyltransferase [bacterium]|nr:WecB/TagA/CpsF family glycosyltransferase [bacterium]